MAVVGSVPESICPVIIPGSETIPIPNIEFSVGRSAVSKAWFTIGSRIFCGVTPRFSRLSICWRFSLSDSQNVFVARLTPVMALPIIMPLRGMTYWGSNMLCPTTAVTKKITMPRPEQVRESEIAILNPLFTHLFFESTLCIAKSIMLVRYISMNIGCGFSKIYVRIKPARVS